MKKQLIAIVIFILGATSYLAADDSWGPFGDAIFDVRDARYDFDEELIRAVASRDGEAIDVSIKPFGIQFDALAMIILVDGRRLRCRVVYQNSDFYAANCAVRVDSNRLAGCDDSRDISCTPHRGELAGLLLQLTPDTAARYCDIDDQLGVGNAREPYDDETSFADYCDAFGD